MTGQHPSTLAVLRYFRWEHLPPHLQVVSRPFAELAQRLTETLPPGPETTVALRKLLESKDAAVRAALPDDPDDGQHALPVFGPPPGSAPTYASGGTTPGLTLVGEQGPELWPPSGWHHVVTSTSKARDGHAHTVTVHLPGHEVLQLVQHRPVDELRPDPGQH